MKYKCTDCSNCLLEDFGYSNWTVEGTIVHCLKGLHPDTPFDHWYGKDQRLLFANRCKKFSLGRPESIDVDREELPNLSQKARSYLNR